MQIQIDWAIVMASVIVGFTVGMTGMGGGALMTPILLIFFGITPTAAVSSDLVAAMVMKPIGGGVHIRRKTVRWELVWWLCLGSIPMAFAGVFILHSTGDSEHIQDTTQLLLGFTLLLAAFAMVFKAWLQGKRSATARREGRATHLVGAPIHVKILPTVLVGATGGLLVGLTSVGSGSLIIICLMLLYPDLRGAELVGTDLVQAVPLVTSAAIAHIIVQDFELGLTASILIGAIPAVYLGARASSIAPDGVIRPLLVLVLLASALKLLDVETTTVGLILLGIIIVGFPLWGAVDASAYPVDRWTSLGIDRERTIRRQAFGAPVLLGLPFAVQYFARIRPRLVALPTAAEVETAAMQPSDPEEG
ncbi:MAG: sulfite exporter TauE/SafE family protein [Actinomycetota bacterium]